MTPFYENYGITYGDGLPGAGKKLRWRLGVQYFTGHDCSYLLLCHDRTWQNNAYLV